MTKSKLSCILATFLSFIFLYSQETEEIHNLAPVVPKTKSGFFLGVEGNLGENTLIQRSNFPSSQNYINQETKKNSFSFDGGLNLGYQHYFDKEALGVKQAYGIDFGVYVGAGVPFEGEVSIKQKAIGYDGVYIFKGEYLPIKAGFDVNFLWDFLEKGNHTLGLTAGIGYRFNYYKSIKNSKNLSVSGDPSSDPRVFDKSFADSMIHNFYPQIGLHYYYGNHQFDLAYRFGGLLTYASSLNQENCFDALGVGAENYMINTQILETSYISFGYAYRF